MIKIYDLNSFPLSYKNGSYGGLAGDKDGITINGEDWMVKYPKNLSQMEGETASYSTAPLSEFLGSHIYDILGYDVHDTILGERNNKLVVACKDFETEGKKLLEVRTLKNHTGQELSDLLEHKPISSSVSHGVDLNELLLHLDKNPVLSQVPGIKQRFFEQSIIDIFINNNDRNNGNWGIIRERGKADVLAPIFDNGGSFSTKVPENKLHSILHSPEFSNNATNVLTAYGKDGKQLNAKRYISAVQDIPEFKQAILKTIPLIQKNMKKINTLFQEMPTSYKLKNGIEIPVLSEERRNFYLSQLSIRIEKLLIPQYQKAEEQNILSDKSEQFLQRLREAKKCLDEKPNICNSHKLDIGEFER